MSLTMTIAFIGLNLPILVRALHQLNYGGGQVFIECLLQNVDQGDAQGVIYGCM